MLLAESMGQHPFGGKPTAYVCESYNCKLPTTDPAISFTVNWVINSSDGNARIKS